MAQLEVMYPPVWCVMVVVFWVIRLKVIGVGCAVILEAGADVVGAEDRIKGMLEKTGFIALAEQHNDPCGKLSEAILLAHILESRWPSCFQRCKHPPLEGREIPVMGSTEQASQGKK